MSVKSSSQRRNDTKRSENTLRKSLLFRIQITNKSNECASFIEHRDMWYFIFIWPLCGLSLFRFCVCVCVIIHQYDLRIFFLCQYIVVLSRLWPIERTNHSNKNISLKFTSFSSFCFEFVAVVFIFFMLSHSLSLYHLVRLVAHLFVDYARFFFITVWSLFGLSICAYIWIHIQ